VGSVRWSASLPACSLRYFVGPLTFTITVVVGGRCCRPLPSVIILFPQPLIKFLGLRRGKPTCLPREDMLCTRCFLQRHGPSILPFASSHRPGSTGGFDIRVARPSMCHHMKPSRLRWWEARTYTNAQGIDRPSFHRVPMSSCQLPIFDLGINFLFQSLVIIVLAGFESGIPSFFDRPARK